MCTPGFEQVARPLGGIDCAHAPAVVSVRPPTALADSTMPVVEALMIIGAVVALVHAVLWWRRRGDPANLGLWCATVVYLLILEPVLYFPDRFGLQDRVGLIFVHNLFTVQLLDNRLPLYIVAVYPALTYPAYVLVQRTGLLDRHSPAAGAACVAVVFHCFYEVFDQIGPQLRWWAWNPQAPSNSPWLAAVPLSSMTIFAAAAPFGMVLLTRLLLARRAARGPMPPLSAALRVVAVGVLTPLAMMVCSIPYGLLSGRSGTARAASLWAVLAILVVVAAVTVRRDLTHPVTRQADGFLDSYPILAGAVFLLVFAGLWVVAPPARPGGLLYASACALAATGILVLAARFGATPGFRRVHAGPTSIRRASGC